jgi:hypothetical protein
MAKEKGRSGGANEHLSRARKQIQEQIELQEQKRRIELQRRRIEIAQKGVKHFAENHLLEAVGAFRTYLSIVEDIKNVPKGGLSPAHFDQKKDMAEMILITGVYWDLVKLYDRTSSHEAFIEFQNYLGRYVAFSKGMPYQTMCAEGLRKHMRTKGAMHKNELKEAYKQLGRAKCFVATELEDVTAFETLPRLRRFRDDVLRTRPAGRLFVAWYYRNGTRIAKLSRHLPQFGRKSLAIVLDGVALVFDKVNQGNSTQR